MLATAEEKRFDTHCPHDLFLGQYYDFDMHLLFSSLHGGKPDQILLTDAKSRWLPLNQHSGIIYGIGALSLNSRSPYVGNEVFGALGKANARYEALCSVFVREFIREQRQLAALLESDELLNQLNDLVKEGFIRAG